MLDESLILTEREIEVLVLMSKGLSNKLIGAELCISDHTVKFHVANVCKKVGHTTRAGAVGEAFRKGLLK